MLTRPSVVYSEQKLCCKLSYEIGWNFLVEVLIAIVFSTRNSSLENKYLLKVSYPAAAHFIFQLLAPITIGKQPNSVGMRFYDSCQDENRKIYLYFYILTPFLYRLANSSK